MENVFNGTKKIFSLYVTINEIQTVSNIMKFLPVLSYEEMLYCFFSLFQ